MRLNRLFLRVFQSVTDSRFVDDSDSPCAEFFAQVVDMDAQSLGGPERFGDVIVHTVFESLDFDGFLIANGVKKVWRLESCARKR